MNNYVHKDRFGQPFTPGSKVLWSRGNDYAGFRTIYTVSHCSRERVSVVNPGYDPSSRWPASKTLSAEPRVLIVVDDLIAKQVARESA